MPLGSRFNDSPRMGSRLRGGRRFQPYRGGGSTSGGDGALASALFWAVKCNLSSNTGYIGVGELEMRLEADGADIATTALAYEGAHWSSNVATRAFDGSSSTFWNARKSDQLADARIGQQFAVAKAIREIAITARVDANNYDQTPTDFEVIYSDDGIEWTTLLAVSGESGWSSGESRTWLVQ